MRTFRANNELWSEITDNSNKDLLKVLSGITKGVLSASEISRVTAMRVFAGSNDYLKGSHCRDVVRMVSKVLTAGTGAAD
jgi:hypothetical protein